MSYATVPEPLAYWYIMWRDGSHSIWQTKLWTEEQLKGLSCIGYFFKLNQ